jgi:hypothetical protein
MSLPVGAAIAPQPAPVDARFEAAQNEPIATAIFSTADIERICLGLWSAVKLVTRSQEADSNLRNMCECWLIQARAGMRL